ncbi:hypothetical protein ASPCADRAFT_5258 [Aspergillus carbonarius ITEM 5010]|uniref:Uncharacterized protein n=1 Tax=Aspergillus carbonarius (strain ITEM 5010) TaxID=602072 RepID=A0A1R3RN57_ASPC5|nr:hypothetical protein ASPCADRAFT_5258 [Aspergillus carbonarius ITEM 5010]
MSVSECCLKTFEWEGVPTRRITKLAGNDVYIPRDNPDAAVMNVPDLLGWSFPNVRFLVDHYAGETKATLYVPDFFGDKCSRLSPSSTDEPCD